MKPGNKGTGLLVRLGVLVVAVLLGQQAMAAGTRAGTQVDNTALVDYQVNGVAQDQLSADANFVVDRRVDFTLTVQDGNLTPVVPGGPPAGDPDYYVEFLLTNTSNGVLDFNIALSQIANVAFGGNGDLDSVDFTTVDFAVAADPVGGASDVPVRGSGDSWVDELDADEAIRIRVYADPQTGLTNGDIAGVALDIAGAEPGGVGVEGGVLDDTTDTALGIDNVFANGNAANAEDGFVVVTADLAVTKSYAVVGGDLGSGLAIPGATIEYTITVVNSSTTTAAEAIAISDFIDTDVTLVLDAYDSGAGSQDVAIDNNGSVSQCSADAADGDADGCELTGGSIIVGGDDSVSLAANGTLTVSFQVLIPDPATTP